MFVINAEKMAMIAECFDPDSNSDQHPRAERATIVHPCQDYAVASSHYVDAKREGNKEEDVEAGQATSPTADKNIATVVARHVLSDRPDIVEHEEIVYASASEPTSGGVAGAGELHSAREHFALAQLRMDERRAYQMRRAEKSRLLRRNESMAAMLEPAGDGATARAGAPSAAGCYGDDGSNRDRRRHDRLQLEEAERAIRRGTVDAELCRRFVNSAGAVDVVALLEYSRLKESGFKPKLKSPPPPYVDNPRMQHGGFITALQFTIDDRVIR